MSSFKKQLLFIVIAVAVITAGGLVIYSATPSGKIAVKPSKTAKLKVVNQQNATSTSNNPVGWWKMDEGTASTSYDSSGNGNTGTLYGGVQWTTGKLGKGLSFDGVDDYVDGPTMTGYAKYSPHTYCAWVKPASVINRGNTGEGVVGIKNYSPYSGTVMCLRHGTAWGNNSYITFWAYPHEYTASAAFYNPNTGNNWYHICTSYAADNNVSFYVNGNFLNTGSISYNWIAPLANYNMIGHGEYFFTGSIDDVRIYNRALSAGEVAQMYNSTKDGYLGNIKVSTGLVGYWKLDDNNALTSVIDYTNKGNTGTAYSGTATSTSVLSTSTAMIGRAMSFDGVDDYVGMPGSVSLGIGDSGTISLWAKMSNWNTSVDNELVNNNLVYSANNSLYISVHNVVGLHFRYGGNAQTGNTYLNYQNSDSWLSNSWHHIVCIWKRNGSATNLYLYADGILVDSDTSALSISLLSSTWNIGKYVGSEQQYFNGLIDEVKIWNYARSAEQILQDYQRGLKGLP